MAKNGQTENEVKTALRFLQVKLTFALCSKEALAQTEALFFYSQKRCGASRREKKKGYGK